MSNNIVLVAPRPVRVNTIPLQHRIPHRSPKILSSPSESFSFLKIGDEGNDRAADDLSLLPDSNRLSDSPRTSPPRPNLSQDALEEFLSILRPSLFSPGSPARSRRHGTTSLPVFPYERPSPYKPREWPHSKTSSISSVYTDENDTLERNTSPSPAGIFPTAFIDMNREEDVNFINVGWHTTGVLESPISRNHTRNPFQRHPSYDMSGFPTFRPSPTLIALPPSPVAEEVDELPPVDTQVTSPQDTEMF